MLPTMLPVYLFHSAGGLQYNPPLYRSADNNTSLIIPVISITLIFAGVLRVLANFNRLYSIWGTASFRF